MSRSYRKQPFMAICGNGSAKQDKRFAARGVRRAHRNYTKTNWELEDFLLPHRHECHWNEVYSWGRDGNQMWRGLKARDWAYYLESLADKSSYSERYGYNEWPPRWYVEMMRK